jgi:hypothetical protein
MLHKSCFVKTCCAFCMAALQAMLDILLCDAQQQKI